ncbi:MAG: AraC family transcriptional regulator [Clostridiales bacterium]|nr:AraC family transcriptional regulator [Clostridiales bacterium]
MEILERMNTAISFIEDNLLNEIDYDEVAKKVYCSSYNFHRMFTFICGISVSEYVRNRRLTLAALELKNSENKVIDVAIKYGYDSSVAFARAFKNLHGVSPSQAKKSNSVLKAVSRLSLLIKIEGDTMMDYRIETRNELKLFGYEAIIGEGEIEKIDKLVRSKENFFHINPSLVWEYANKTGLYEKILLDKGYDEHPEFLCGICGIHAIMDYKNTPKNTFSYMLGAFTTKDSKTENYDIVTIPAATYAVFPFGGFDWKDCGKVVVDLIGKFYKEWLPSTKYDKADTAEFEIYGGTEEKGYIEIWMPIIKK